MGITSKKPIGKAKEIFLALCLIGGEISSKTVAMLKEDYGNDYIKANVIYYLTKMGCIKRIGVKKDYGYILTPKGCEYLRIKLSDKYDYSDYTNSTSYVSNNGIRIRNRRLTELIYLLYRNGVEFCNHYGDIARIINGYEVTISKPFFVTTKVLRKTNERLAVCFGSRIYGCIVTKTSIIVVYSPDKEHNLYLSREESMQNNLSMLMSRALPPYNEVGALKALYLYPTTEDVIDSFEITPEKIGKSVAQTKKVYENLKYLVSYMNVFNGRTSYDLKYVLDTTLEQRINEVFVDYFELTPCQIKAETSFADSIYDDDILTAVNWMLNPYKIVEAINYVKKKENKILMLCFEEQKELLTKILSISRAAEKYIVIAYLSSKDVIDYIEGKIEEIE